MHRSGTSLTAKIVNIAGAYLGEDSALMAADQSNAKGYWENLTFLGFNDKLLNHFGGSWYAPPALPTGWQTDEPVIELQKEARAYVSLEFGNKEIWAWKEPRTTVILPFWQSIVPNAKYVICVRNPLDVAASLTKRNQFTLKQGIALWHIYTLRALLDTIVADSMIVLYDELVDNPRQTAERLLSELDLAKRMDSARWKDVDSFVDPGLEHHHHSFQDLLDHPDVSAPVKEFYEILVDGTRDAAGRYAQSQLASIDVLNDYLQVCAQASDLRQQYAALEQQAAMQLNAARDTIEHLQGVLNTRPHRLATSLSRSLNCVRKPPARNEK